MLGIWDPNDHRIDLDVLLNQKHVILTFLFSAGQRQWFTITDILDNPVPEALKPINNCGLEMHVAIALPPGSYRIRPRYVQAPCGTSGTPMQPNAPVPINEPTNTIEYWEFPEAGKFGVIMAVVDQNVGPKPKSEIRIGGEEAATAPIHPKAQDIIDAVDNLGEILKEYLVGSVGASDPVTGSVAD
jgi:hypothetical protein